MSEKIALVGSESLMGRELRDLIDASPLAASLQFLAGEGEASVLTEIDGEPVALGKLDRDSVEDAGVVVLAGRPESTREALTFDLKTPLVDLTHEAEDHPRARLRAPLLEPHDFRVAPDAVQVIAHPASIATALLLTRVHSEFPIHHSIVHVFEPASERGSAGVEELQKQTVSLLSFQPMPKKVFDSQLSFAMLAKLGEEATVHLEEVEARIERHLASLLVISGVPVPMPSIRLLQAPVFHGHTFSVWIEFEGDAPSVEDFEELFAKPPFALHAGGDEPPNNIGIAGQNEVAVGAIVPDRNRSNALWLWMAADNLRLAAENALAVVQEVL